MKTLKKVLLTVLALLAIVVAVAFIFIGSVKKGAIPVYDGELVLKGLDEEVNVFFDERGMPHIYAGTEKDLYFAVGYLSARERLWQMDLIRRATRGRLSEIFGEDYVNTDVFLRSLCINEKSKMILGNLVPDAILVLEYYCDGVNRYISDAGKKLPPEFRILGYEPDAWTPEDIANIVGYIGWDLASSTLAEEVFIHKVRSILGNEAARLIIPDWKLTDTLVFPEFTLADSLLKHAGDFIASTEKLKNLGIFEFSGSNNWALSGNRTNTGKPILSNDMHLGLSSPGMWMQMHQVVPGKINVTGVVVPGQPFVISGHNEKIAWGMTNLAVDDIDLFMEITDSTRPGMYLFNGDWMQMEERKEIIKIKGGDEVERSIVFTHHGPVISGMRNINDATLAMRWSGYDLSDEIAAVYKLNRADSWDEFRNALSSFGSISQNFAYADVEGNIGLQTGGGIPVRAGSGTIIRDGSTDQYDWKGYVPFNQLPYSFNPESGHVESANNKTVNEDYPYYISTSFALPYRISRIREMIAEKEIHTIDDFKMMINDQQSYYASMLVPVVLASLEKGGVQSGPYNDEYMILKEWDYVMSAESEAPSIFEFFRMTFAEELLADDLGEMFTTLPAVYRDYYIYRTIVAGADTLTDRKETASVVETLDDIIKASFEKGLTNLDRFVSDNDLKSRGWGKIHVLKLDHPMGSVKIIDMIFKLNSPAYPVGGSDHTVSPYRYGSNFMVVHGASQRHIYNTANWDESWSIIPTGNSGVPGSPFYLSQTKAYVSGQFYRDYFTEDAVKANAAHKMVLVPVK